MALRAAKAAAPATRGLRALLSTFSPSFPFNTPSKQVEKPPPAEPSTNLFVSGLSKRTTSEGLREAFVKHGEVVHARVVTDRVSGYSKGFGFVRYATLEDAEAGIKGMDGQVLTCFRIGETGEIVTPTSRRCCGVSSLNFVKQYIIITEFCGETYFLMDGLSLPSTQDQDHHLRQCRTIIQHLDMAITIHHHMAVNEM